MGGTVQPRGGSFFFHVCFTVSYSWEGGLPGLEQTTHPKPPPPLVGEVSFSSLWLVLVQVLIICLSILYHLLLCIILLCFLLYTPSCSPPPQVPLNHPCQTCSQLLSITPPQVSQAWISETHLSPHLSFVTPYRIDLHYNTSFSLLILSMFSAMVAYIYFEFVVDI